MKQKSTQSSSYFFLDLFSPPLPLVCASCSSRSSPQMDQLLGSVIEMWVDRMDNITQPERRKLSSLALLSLLPSDNRCNTFSSSAHFHHHLQVHHSKNCIIQFMNVADKLRAARHRRYSRLLYVWPSLVTVSSSPMRKTMRLCFCRQLCVCSLSASQSVFTLVVLKLQARSGRGSQSLESNHQRVAGPDRIRPDTPLSAWQRIFNMMPASICCHGYKFEILLGARLQTCPMMHFARPLLVYKGCFLTDSQLLCFSTRASEQVFPHFQRLLVRGVLNWWGT